jgi:ParB family transcriptional regulator, chromosome partitioning protein
LTELADSVRAHGILQPLIVTVHPEIPGRYQLLAGHRRLAAAKLARVDRVPCMVRGDPGKGDAPAIEVMLVENCQRRDLGPVDKAEAMGALRKAGYTAAEICRRTGLSSATVTNYLALLELSAASLEQIRSGVLTAEDGLRAVRVTRARARKRSGTPAMGAVWEPDHFTASHPLARHARALCEAREHTLRRRIGKTACGQCWETAIRKDEQTATAALGSLDAQHAGS